MNAEQIDMYWPGGSPARSQQAAQEQRERMTALLDQAAIPAEIHAESYQFRANSALFSLLDHIDRLVDYFASDNRLTNKPIHITPIQRALMLSRHDTYLSLRVSSPAAAEQFARQFATVKFFYRGHLIKVTS